MSFRSFARKLTASRLTAWKLTTGGSLITILCYGFSGLNYHFQTIFQTFRFLSNITRITHTFDWSQQWFDLWNGLLECSCIMFISWDDMSLESSEFRFK